MDLGEVSGNSPAALSPLLAGEQASTVADVAVRLGIAEDVLTQLGVVWGKSAERAGGVVNLLLAHMVDTALVAERMWLEYLAPHTRLMVDSVAPQGEGLPFFMWLCGLHDWGKATPAFQSKHPASAGAVRAAGLDWDRLGSGAKLAGFQAWRHEKASAVLAATILTTVQHGWSREQVGWVWPLLGGHHGRVPTVGEIDAEERSVQIPMGIWAGSPWPRVQHAVLEVFTRALGFSGPGAVQPVRRPAKADQLALSGLIIMADWIASNSTYFTGLDDLAAISVERCRDRAIKAWEDLGLRGGWGAIAEPEGDPVTSRFGVALPRASQSMLVDLARSIPAPGLLIVEAPMGEGKTEGALAAAEVLAARFGLDGLFVGMPTQATSDPMFGRVRGWAEAAFGPQVAAQAALLHGKARFNTLWKQLIDTFGSRPGRAFAGVDEFGQDEDDFFDSCGVGDAAASSGTSERHAPAAWFLGPKRGLLAGIGVGTIDQLLYAATRTKHVMLRFAGLAGKVVVVDEVHAADMYMQQFLGEALFWLGQARVPVLLLSATLPPSQRHALLGSYLSGALGQAGHTAVDIPEPEGYPSVTAVWADPRKDSANHEIRACEPWRAPYPVRLRILPDTGREPRAAVDVVKEKLSAGGVALVILNTVDRAQYMYKHLNAEFGDDVALLHGRLNVADRADRTDTCVTQLGPHGEARPARRIVVATQVAEQSFDIDADLLVTDIAPIDLLLQRIGRLHRHERSSRPEGFTQPTVFVTGLDVRADRALFDSGAEAIYGRSRLLRTAAKIRGADGVSWTIPTQVPSLVACVYGSHMDVPETWLDDTRDADGAWSGKQEARADDARRFLLTTAGQRTKKTLEGLHTADTNAKDERAFEAVVRDGKPTIEVILVRRRTQGGYASLRGTSLGVNGEGTAEALEEVLGGTVRLPARLTDAALTQLAPLPGWSGDPWLKHTRALVLESDGVAHVGDCEVSYDERLGLIVRNSSRSQ
jgi:CRISPR-associated endonuclease/helicase Cas3